MGQILTEFDDDGDPECPPCGPLLVFVSFWLQSLRLELALSSPCDCGNGANTLLPALPLPLTVLPNEADS